MLELKEVVLNLARKEMHPQLKYLEEVIAIQNREERFEKIEAYIEKATDFRQTAKTIRNFPFGEMYLDPPLVQLYLAANQLVEDMERLDEIPDLNLHARTVLVREELCLLEEEYHSNSKSKLFTIFPKNKIPTTEISFLKELLKIGDGNRRKAILVDAFNYSNSYAHVRTNKSYILSISICRIILLII
jgi:hypothetical protein